MDKVSEKDTQFTAEQRLKEDGTFELRSTVAIPTGPITSIVYGTWRVGPGHLYETATNEQPSLGTPLNKEETYVLISVGASKYSMRTPDGQVRTFRKRK